MKKKNIIIFIIINLFVSLVFPIGQNNNSEIRIVSLAPAITKDIFYLGLEKYLVGVTDYCKFEDKLDKLINEGKIKRVSGYSAFNYELIISQKPTYILCMDSTSMEQYEMLKKISDCKVISYIHPKNIEEIKEQLVSIGKIFNAGGKALQIIYDMDKKLKNVNKKYLNIDYKKRPSVLVEIYFPPFMTCGENTFISDIIIKAGGRLSFNIKTDWPQITLEEIIKANPDVIVKGHISETNKNLFVIDAYKKNHIFMPKNIDDFQQPGIQSINAVIELNDYLEKNFLTNIRNANDNLK